MPRISLPAVPSSYDRKQLLQELSKELSLRPSPSSSPMQQPLILEQAIQQDSLRITVLWNKWENVPAEDRSSIIYEAYTESDEQKEILWASGFTYKEALDANLLPYEIQPVVKKDDPIAENSIRQAMRNEGAIETPTGLRLCFPTLELANESFNRLKKKNLDSFFALVQHQYQD